MTGRPVEEMAAASELTECLDDGEWTAARQIGRQIAGYWHGGQSSALYSFSSADYIRTGELRWEVDHDLTDQGAELDLALEHAGPWDSAYWERLDTLRDNVTELTALARLVAILDPDV